MQAEPIIVAVLALAGVVFSAVWQGRKTRRLNTEEHKTNTELLRDISTKVDVTRETVEGVQERLNDHIRYHEIGERKRWFRK